MSMLTLWAISAAVVLISCCLCVYIWYRNPDIQPFGSRTIDLGTLIGIVAWSSIPIANFFLFAGCLIWFFTEAAPKIIIFGDPGQSSKSDLES